MILWELGDGKQTKTSLVEMTLDELADLSKVLCQLLHCNGTGVVGIFHCQVQVCQQPNLIRSHF